jgi:hypothetical protein
MFVVDRDTADAGLSRDESGFDFGPIDLRPADADVSRPVQMGRVRRERRDCAAQSRDQFFIDFAACEIRAADLPPCPAEAQ